MDFAVEMFGAFTVTSVKNKIMNGFCCSFDISETPQQNNLLSYFFNSNWETK